MRAASHAPAAVILCAGGSRRMGEPKGLLPWREGTLVEAHVRALSQVAGPVIVVLGAAAEAYRAAVPPGARIVVNPDWATTTPIDSVRLGLAAVDRPCFVTPVDTPPAAPETLRALLAATGPAVPVDAAGRRGHPVLLDRATVDRVRTSPLPDGLRGALVDAREVRVDDPFVAEDFDDRPSWERFVRARG